ncbi:DUF4389 domain-containing protein [uncultured Maritimibacter sp.]|jgi:hypothetical protein|uniref:DUF4389 domain-containing protein n=1 Tax=uncultured Maritimibacter sp. TaxID=991866 RepID=UPI0026252134|nr:DUF4389 domain-containing protein [uncultured Maritimibacter sp.]
MTDKDDPVRLEEPGAEDRIEIAGEPDNVWMRGLWMVMFIIMMWVGRMLVLVAGVVQFLWLLFSGEKNRHVAEFGEDLADWMARATLYVAASTNDRPFPFDRWGIPD